MTNTNKGKNKPTTSAERKAAGLPAIPKTTPLPKAVAKADRSNMQAIADEVAKTYHGKILRFVVREDVLVILFVDGRKHYVKLDKNIVESLLNNSLDY